MQRKRRRGESAKQVAVDVLSAAGEPLHAKEIAKRVIESGRCSGLKGKTPEATVAALLAVGSKPEGPFKRVDKATYTLSESVAEPERPKPTEREGKTHRNRTKTAEATDARAGTGR